MNKETRKDIAKIVVRLQLIKNEIEKIKDNEEDKFDNLSEGLQATMKGQDMEEAIEYLGDALDNIYEAIGNLELM